MSSFETLGVQTDIIQAVEEMGWDLPRDVQEEAIPHILNGADVMIAAETGSGKTGAIALPIVQLLYERLTHAAQLGIKEVEDPNLGCVLNINDRDSEFALSEDRLLGQSRDLKKWYGCRATLGTSSQAFNQAVPDKRVVGLYYEVVMTDDGLCRVGISQADSKYEIGQDNKSWGYGGTGKISHNQKFIDFELGGFQNGDVIGVLVNFRSRTLSFTKNGSQPCIASEPLPNNAILFPSCVVKNAELRFNFKGPFQNTPPIGYIPWSDVPTSATNLNQVETEESKSSTASNGTKRRPSCLILEPTRELTVQFYQELQKFTKYLQYPKGIHPIKISLCVAQLKEKVSDFESDADIVVATVGTAQSLMKSKELDVSGLTAFILDEADAIVEMNEFFLKNVIRLCRKKPQIVICSATLYSDKIAALSAAICRFPTYVDLKGRNYVPENVDHVVFSVDSAKDLSWVPKDVQISESLKSEHFKSRDIPQSMISKESVNWKGIVPQRPTEEWMKTYLDGVHNCLGTAKSGGMMTDRRDALSLGTKILKLYALLKILDTLQPSQAILFCRTRIDCDNLKKFLDYNAEQKGASAMTEESKGPGYSSVVLHGKQEGRERDYQLFKQGKVRFLICTDIAARGLDVKELPLVVNLTLPDSPETYVHRVGRTGRAGAQGMAVSIVDSSFEERVWYHTCRSTVCQNTEMKEQGGCNTWLVESILLSDIEGSLSSIRIPNVDLSTLKDGLTRIRTIAATSRPAVSRHTLEAIQHVSIVQPQSARLAQLETQAQRTHLEHFKKSASWAQRLHSLRTKRVQTAE